MILAPIGCGVALVIVLVVVACVRKSKSSKANGEKTCYIDEILKIRLSKNINQLLYILHTFAYASRLYFQKTKSKLITR